MDDSPAIAQILQEGLSHCRKRSQANDFLSKIGARGKSYAEMTVESFAESGRQGPRLDPMFRQAAEASKDNCVDCFVPDELCTTHRELDSSDCGDSTDSTECTTEASDRTVAVRCQSEDLSFSSEEAGTEPSDWMTHSCSSP